MLYNDMVMKKVDKSKIQIYTSQYGVNTYVTIKSQKGFFPR